MYTTCPIIPIGPILHGTNHNPQKLKLLCLEPNYLYPPHRYVFLVSLPLLHLSPSPELITPYCLSNPSGMWIPWGQDYVHSPLPWQMPVHNRCSRSNCWLTVYFYIYLSVFVECFPYIGHWRHSGTACLEDLFVSYYCVMDYSINILHTFWGSGISGQLSSRLWYRISYEFVITWGLQ